MKTIAIIPARGGSKGIIRKNLRIFNGKPLIYYVVQNALKSKKIDDVVLTTESEEIIDYCRKFDIKIRKRPNKLSDDDVTLDPVIYDALMWFEDNHYSADNVITLQPTSPLLSVSTLDKAIIEFEQSDLDTLISVEDNTSLGWKEEKGKLVKDYEKRVNRQSLPKRYKETGSFLISKTNIVSENTRLGSKVGIYKIPKAEAIDIDSEIDWYIAENIAKRLKIVFITSANEKIGMGHICRCISLANHLIGHIRDFIIFKTFDKGKKLLGENNYSYKEIEDINQIEQHIDNYEIIINDFLDTSIEYMNLIKDKFVINFEDLGEGADKANLVFNALYEYSYPKENHRFGWRYVILDDKILTKTPIVFNKQVREILVTFGGVDQNNLSLKSLKVLENFDDLIVKIIIGPGYQFKEELKEFLKNSKLNFNLLSEVKDMGKEMENIDLAITSNGRTVYELAAMNIPIISISQNDRETLHLFSRYSKGVRYLGISCNVTDESLYATLKELIEKPEKRYKMYKSLAESNIREGIKTVKEEIINSFWRYKGERDNNW